MENNLMVVENADQETKQEVMRELNDFQLLLIGGGSADVFCQ